MFLTIDNGRIGSSEPSIRYKLVSSAKDAAFHDPTQISDKALAFWSAVHNREPESNYFSARESMLWWRAKWRTLRKAAVQPSQIDRSVPRPKRGPGVVFSRMAYAKAIARACEKGGVPHWHPNQLRHTAATKARAQFGLEAAQAILGHSRADVTQVYAERDSARAIEAIGTIG